MNVKLILSADRKMCGYAPADSENQPTLILMVGCASERSVRKTIKKWGHTITQIIDQRTPLGSLCMKMGWPARIVDDQVEVTISPFRYSEYQERAVRWCEDNPDYTAIFYRTTSQHHNLITMKIKPMLRIDA